MRKPLCRSDEQCAGRHVPHLEAHHPDAVEAPGGKVRHAASRRPHTLWDWSLSESYRRSDCIGLKIGLDQYKEKTPKDPTIREKFNTYRFADYKENVIDLLMRVLTVSVETQKVIDAMARLPR